MSRQFYFIFARSFAAPFFSDDSTHYIEASGPQEALEELALKYTHPAGLYAAEAWANADAYHKGERPLARWLSNHEQAKQQLTKDKSAYSYMGHGPGDFEINRERHKIENPKGGSVVPA